MSSEPEPNLDARIMVMRIINFALLMGAVVFLGVAVFLRGQGEMPPPPEVPLLTYLALAVILPNLIAYAVVPNLQIAAIRRRLARGETGSLGDVPLSDTPGSWYAVYQTRLILRLALLEGTTFFLLLAYLLEGQAISLVAAGLLMLGIAAHFPSKAAADNWMETQRELLQRERNETI